MKTYKGLDLVKAVANYEIEKGTKLKCIHYLTYGQGIEVDEYQERLIWSDTKEPIRYTHFLDNQFEFEIIEEKEIEKLIFSGDGHADYTSVIPKINELIDAVNKLKEK